jgi:arabinogalactan oligomer / maltooligosaccharide transport system permease protein
MSDRPSNTHTRTSLADTLLLVSAIVTLIAFLLLPWARMNVDGIRVFSTGAEAIGGNEFAFGDDLPADLATLVDELATAVDAYEDAVEAGQSGDAEREAVLAMVEAAETDSEIGDQFISLYASQLTEVPRLYAGVLPILIFFAGLVGFVLAPVALFRPVYSRTLRPVTLVLGGLALAYFLVYFLFPTPSFQIIRAANAEGLGFWLTLLGSVGMVAQGFVPRPAMKTQFMDRQELYAILVRYVIMLAIVTFALFPVVWIVSASLNPRQTMQGQRVVPDVDSVEQLFSNYDTLLNTPRKPFARWVLNSVIVSTTTSVAAVLVTALAAYSFSRFRFRGRQSLLVTILLVQVFPNLLAMVAIFLMLQQIGNHLPFLGINTLGGLILVYIGGQMGINIWLMKGFFDSIPRDIDEAALVDGATHSQIFWQLIIPSVRPILVVVGILAFVATFNEFVLARVLLRDAESFTLMVGLWGFISDRFAQQWGVFAAGAVLGALPTLIIYLLLQDQIVGGLTQGAVKG